MKRKALAGMIAVIAALAIIIMAIGGCSKGKQPVSGEEDVLLQAEADQEEEKGSTDASQTEPESQEDTGQEQPEKPESSQEETKESVSKESEEGKETETSLPSQTGKENSSQGKNTKASDPADSQEEISQPEPEQPSQEAVSQPEPEQPSQEAVSQPEPEQPSQGSVSQPEPEQPSQTPAETAPEPAVHVHTWVTDTTEPTCTEAGSTKTYCSGCGEVQSETTLAATGHTMVENWAFGQKPTCTQHAWKEVICSKCGYVEFAGNVDPIPHTTEAVEIQHGDCVADTIIQNICTVCGLVVSEERHTEPDEHTWVWGESLVWDEEAFDFVTVRSEYCSRCNAHR